MMPSRSNQKQNSSSSTVYSYNQISYEAVNLERERDVVAPPVRDSATLKGVKYGPGHEKYPSWPVPAKADTPQALRTPPSGGSHRSKSWTDQTNYPKEKVIPYIRPFMKTKHLSTTPQQKLKTVMEKCEKIPSQVYESRYLDKKPSKHRRIPSPPERDIPTIQRDIETKPMLTKEDLEEYARSYQDPIKFYDDKTHLTEQFMETYSQNYEDSLLFNSISSNKGSDDGILGNIHQKQLSYAQSEGYHSYVSSSDSTSTPFLDRLRRDSEANVRWDETSEHRYEGRDSVVTTSSGSASSSETLKWLGSISDVSISSSNNNLNSRQLIVHSARVQTPQKYHSESVLSSDDVRDERGVGVGDKKQWCQREARNNDNNKLKLFPVNTYTVPNDSTNNGGVNKRHSMQASLSVADRISEIEKQRYSYLDPDKKHKVPDPTLKAIQKKALLSFYERHNAKNSWRSEPQLVQKSVNLSISQPPPRVKVHLPSRRASSASDYAAHNGISSRRSSLASRESKTTDSITGSPKLNGLNGKSHQSNSCGSLVSDLMVGPMILGPAISLDDFVPCEQPPERPPKNPSLRNTFPELFTPARDTRMVSPDLPPPPPVTEDEVICDKPLPPPPPSDWEEEFNARLKVKQMAAQPLQQTHLSSLQQTHQSQQQTHQSSQIASQQVTHYQKPAVIQTDRQVKRGNSVRRENSLKQTVGLPERLTSVRSSIRTRPMEHIIQQVSSKPYDKSLVLPPNQKGYADRSSTKYPLNNHKMTLNNPPIGGTTGAKIATSQKLNSSGQYRAEPLRSVMLKEGDNHMRDREFDNSVPPPLQPRLQRVNQSMRGRISLDAKQHYGKQIGGQRNEPHRQSMSQSKASYLATRRERDRVVPDSDTGSYKRTISPNGHPETTLVLQDNKNNNRETVWPNKNNNNLIVRRDSLNKKNNPVDGVQNPCEGMNNKILILPDVLPVNAKFITRSPQFLRDERNFSPQNSPPKSPPKSPQRGSPFTPLRSTVLSNLPQNKDDTSPRSSFVAKQPLIKHPLSPQAKLSPVKLSQTCVNSLETSSSILGVGVSPISTPSPLSTPLQSPKVSTPPLTCGEIEGLQFMQKSELVLRINAPTTDAASQTEIGVVSESPLPLRKKLQEEIDCDKLSQDLVSHLAVSDRLKDILVPGPEYKKTRDYVQGLFKVEVKPRPLNSPFRSKSNTPSSSPPLTPSSLPPNKISTSSLTVETSPISSNSAYFTTSEPKAKLLTHLSVNPTLQMIQNTKDLNQKKDELVCRLDRKLEVLRQEQLDLVNETLINEELGQNVEAHIRNVARPHEAAKFKVHVQEVGKITSLLLNLSGRLARAENALIGMLDDSEKQIMESKRDKLFEQLEEAKSLKESIDKRSVNVSNILGKYLNLDEYSDYEHFINMKAKLIMDTREIADKIKLGEEQLRALKDTLID